MGTNQILIILAIVIIIAVVAFLVGKGSGEKTGEAGSTSSVTSSLSMQNVLTKLNKCIYYDGQLQSGQSCNSVCAQPSIWGNNGPKSTCITGQFSSTDLAYPSELVRCDFTQAGRELTCVCCTP